MSLAIIGIDPGISGALVALSQKKDPRFFFKFQAHAMPLDLEGKEKRISFSKVRASLKAIQLRMGDCQVYLERAVPMAMGSKAAFNYGRGFEALILALETLRMPYTLIEPQKWAKEMHQGISCDLKPKAKSLVAVKRLYPQLFAQLPVKPKGGIHDGMVDALLIAGYGFRCLGNVVNRDTPEVGGDFY